MARTIDATEEALRVIIETEAWGATTTQLLRLISVLVERDLLTSTDIDFIIFGDE